MPTNGFEGNRISEGTMRPGAQHVSNLPRDIHSSDPYSFDTPRDTAHREVLNGHPVKTPTGRRVLGSAAMVGAGVRNPAGDSLGKIEDIMIDLSAGRIAYVVLSFGGLFGIGSKLFILPWSALTFDQRLNEFILDIQREVLEKGPGFDRDNWPDLTDPAYGADIHRHYGKTPYWEQTMTDFNSEEFRTNRCCE